MYLLIFGHVLEDKVQVFDGVGYTSFLIPGLVMMSVLQNSFANSSSSADPEQDHRQPGVPAGHAAVALGLVRRLRGRRVVRGLVVGLRGVCWSPCGLRRRTWRAAWWILVFAALGAGMLGALGLIAGLWAEKFDQMAAFQNFIIMPMTFLSGVFYSVHSLPPFWQAVSHLNPFFYMIDGFRRGFFGTSDVSPWLSLAVVGTAFVVVSGIALRLLKTGYKIRP
jgi:ABC-2 type transport system permease protein